MRTRVGTDPRIEPADLRLDDPEAERERRRRKWAWIQANEPALAEWLVALREAGLDPKEPLIRPISGRSQGRE